MRIKEIYQQDTVVVIEFSDGHKVTVLAPCRTMATTLKDAWECIDDVHVSHTKPQAFAMYEPGAFQCTNMLNYTDADAYRDKRASYAMEDRTADYADSLIED